MYVFACDFEICLEISSDKGDFIHFIYLQGVEISSDKEEEADGDPYKMLDVNLDA